MATKKTIEFKAKFDLSEFDKGAQKVQERMRQITAPTTTSAAMQKAQSMMAQLGIGQITPQDEARRRSYDNTVKQSQRELEQLAQRQWQAAQKLEAILDKRIEKLNKLKDLEKGLLLTNQDTSRIKEQIARSEERIAITRSKATGRALNVQSAAETLQDMAAESSGGYGGLQASPMDRIRRAYGMYGMGGAVGMAGRMAGGLGNIASGAMGVAGAALGAYNLYNQQSLVQRDYDLSVRRAQGAVINNTPTGQARNAILARQGTDFLYESAERQQALAEAGKYKEDLERKTSLSGVMGRAGQAALGAGAVGLKFGGIKGALLGLAAGGGASLLSDLSDPLSRSTMFGTEAERQTLLSSKAAERYKETLEAEKAKNPLKFFAQDEYKRNAAQDLQLQRSLGLSDAGFYGKENAQSGNVVGGMYNNLLAKGFTRDEIFSGAGSVLQAGGSTSSATSATGLLQQMQRAGISNAGQTIGTISRITGSVAETEQATIKVMEEAFKRGLDKSEFRQESVKFQEVLAGAIATSGVTSEQGAINAAQRMAGFISDPTNMQSISAATGAKNWFDQNMQNILNQSIQAGGGGGGGGIMDIPGLDVASSKALLGMSMDELRDPENVQVLSAYEKAKKDTPELTKEQFINQVSSSKLNATTVTKEGESAVNKAIETVKTREAELIKSGATASKAREQAKKEFLSSAKAGGVMDVLGLESSSFEKLSQSEKKNVISQSIELGLEPLEYKKDVLQTLKGDSGEQAIGTAMQEAEARQTQLANEAFVTEGYQGLKDAAVSLKTIAKEAMNAAVKLESATKAGDVKQIAESIPSQPKPLTPPKAGASRP